MVHCTPDKNSCPEYSVQFDNMKSENGKLGFFNTALFKQIKLEKLSLSTYSYLNNNTQTSPDPALCLMNLRASLLEQLRSISKKKSTIQELAKAVQVDIDGFNFNWLHNHQSQLAIQSKRTLWAAQNLNHIILRGAVKIQMPENKIQSNEVVWDIQKQIFYINGSYVLTTQNNKKIGRNICLDAQLNILDSQNTLVTIQKGETQCIAKIPY